jgi:hypothetical protein
MSLGSIGNDNWDSASFYPSFAYNAAKDGGNLADLPHQLREIVRKYGLIAIGQSIVRLVVHLDDQTVGPDRYRRT